jgi:hypothetical protein
MIKLYALILGLCLTACDPPQSSAERIRVEAQRTEARLGLERNFPQLMVICNAETGKAYIAKRTNMVSSIEFEYSLSNFPGPNWKCPAVDSGEKQP